MRVDAKIFWAALKHPDAGERHPAVEIAELEISGVNRSPASWAPVSSELIEWARQCGITEPLLKVFGQAWPTSWADIGPWSRLWDMASIRQEMETYPGLLQKGFFIIGSVLNGDWIVVDLEVSRGAVGYIGKYDVLNPVGPEHDRQLALTEDVRKKFVQISPSLGAFVLGVVKDAIQIDSYGTWSEENEQASWAERYR